MSEQSEYGWDTNQPTEASRFLLKSLLSILPRQGCKKVLDIGCGNGAIAGELRRAGHRITGVDVSADGIRIARACYPDIDFHVCSIYDEQLHEKVDADFDYVIAIEVIEHLFFPKELLRRAYRVLKPGGIVIVTTPYHGYVKNMAISLINGWDRHFGVAWDGGHIKFFSKATLARMAQGAGFHSVRFRGVGRVPCLWKSMIMVAEK